MKIRHTPKYEIPHGDKVQVRVTSYPIDTGLPPLTEHGVKQEKQRLDDHLEDFVGRLHPSVAKAVRRNLLINIRNALNYQARETQEVAAIALELDAIAQFETW